MGSYGKNMRDCCDSLARNYEPHIKGCKLYRELSPDVMRGIDRIVDAVSEVMKADAAIGRNESTLDSIVSSLTINGKEPTDSTKAAFRKALVQIGVKNPPKQIRPTYCGFVEYIALNDDYDLVSEGGPTVCISMVSHMFQKDLNVVIADVLACRSKHDA